MERSNQSDIRNAVFVGTLTGVFLFLLLNSADDTVLLRYKSLVLVLSPLLFGCVFYATQHLLQASVHILSLLKFGMVGSMNTVLDMAIVTLLITHVGYGGGFHFLLYKIFSFTIAVTHAYLWNRSWTFASKQVGSAKEYSLFLLTNVGGAAINVTVATALVMYFTVWLSIDITIAANGAIVAATLCSMVWNYLLQKKLFTARAP